MEDAIWVKYQRDPSGSKRHYREPPMVCVGCDRLIETSDYVVIQLRKEDAWEPVYCYECGSMKRAKRNHNLRSLRKKAKEDD